MSAAAILPLPAVPAALLSLPMAAEAQIMLMLDLTERLSLRPTTKALMPIAVAVTLSVAATLLLPVIAARPCGL